MVLAILVLFLWSLAFIKPVIDLARGDAAKSFRGALIILVPLSLVIGSLVFQACTEGGLKGGLNQLIHGHYSILFWITFPGQIAALIVLLLSWRKKRPDPE